MLSPITTALVALFAQAAASAPPSASPAQPATPSQAANAAPAVVCRSETETGSRFTHRVCHTPAEWNALSAAATDSVSKMQQQGGMTGGPH